MIGHVVYNKLNIVNTMVDMVNMGDIVNMVDMMTHWWDLSKWSKKVVNVVNMFIVLIKMVNIVNILNICRSSTLRTSTCSIAHHEPVWSKCCRLFRQCHQQRKPRKVSDICHAPIFWAFLFRCFWLDRISKPWYKIENGQEINTSCFPRWTWWWSWLYLISKPL